MRETCKYDLTIVGAGVAGLTAALHAAADGLNVRLVSDDVGGQARRSPLLENYLGFERGISGPDLISASLRQLSAFGVRVTRGRATGLENHGTRKCVVLGNGQRLESSSVLIASGLAIRQLTVPGAKRFAGNGVHYELCGADYEWRNNEVVVVGSGNAALQNALSIAELAADVHVVSRHALVDHASQYLLERLWRSPSITVYEHCEVTNIVGRSGVEVVHCRRRGNTLPISAQCVFAFLGGIPKTDWAQGVARTEEGYILTGRDVPSEQPSDGTCWETPSETSVSGFFAAGDVRHGSTKRLSAAAGEGASAVRDIHRFLAQKRKHFQGT